MTIDELFDGEWKSEDEYLIRCPYCQDHKTHNHCFVNVRKGMFVCHYCGESGTTKKLSRDFADGEKLEPRLTGIQEKKKYEEVDFSQFKKVTGLSGTVDRMALGYLKGRGIVRKHIKEYDIRFSNFGRYYGRVIIPIYEGYSSDPYIVCFIARSFMKMVKPKFLFPHHGETRLTTSECIFGWDYSMNESDSDMFGNTMVIVEGVFDAIAVNGFGSRIHGLSILSKQLSNAQLYKLLRLPKALNFYVMLDGDARKDAIKIARTLSNHGRDVQVALLDDGEDPGSIDYHRFWKIMDSAPAMSLDLEMRTMLDAKKG